MSVSAGVCISANRQRVTRKGHHASLPISPFQSLFDFSGSSPAHFGTCRSTAHTSIRAPDSVLVLLSPISVRLGLLHRVVLGMQRYDHTSAPWAWRLDPHSGSSSSLGPTVSTTHLASDPLTPLSRSSASSSADSIFWQDFRPTGQQPFIRMSKSTKLHRFDSDDEEQGSPLKACKEEAVAIGGWQEEDARVM